MPEAILAFAAAAFGLIVGSFINALAFRFNTGLSVMRGRSRCMHCGHTLSALELIPVLSYVVLRGRCRWCRSKISAQYPLVECVAAALSFGVFATTGLTLFSVLWFCIWMTILFIVVYDLRHTVIPWSASFLLMALSLGVVFVSGDDLLMRLAAGPILAFPLLFISFISRGTWMGWGDGFFELSLGWMLGLVAGFSALLFSIWIGALVGVMLVLWAQLPSLRKRGFTMKSELPFAPFLAIGTLLVYFFHVSLFSTFTFF